MKKIAYILLPMLCVIAIIFYIRDKPLSWTSFMLFIENLRFDNAIQTLNKASSNLSNSVLSLNSIFNSSSILDGIRSLLTGLVNIIKGMYYLTLTLFELVKDIVNNLFVITDFLFGTEVKY